MRTAINNEVEKRIGEMAQNASFALLFFLPSAKAIAGDIEDKGADLYTDGKKAPGFSHQCGRFRKRIFENKNKVING